MYFSRIFVFFFMHTNRLKILFYCWEVLIKHYSIVDLRYFDKYILCIFRRIIVLILNYYLYIILNFFMVNIPMVKIKVFQSFEFWQSL